MHRILIIGVGSIGERHVRCFLATQRAIVSICETNSVLGQQVTERYQIQGNYSDLASVPTDQFDAAVICTPAHLHVPMAMQLVEQDKHVLIEKPLSTSLAGVDQLSQVTDVVIGVAYVMRVHPTLRAVRDVLQQGRFGTPVQLVYSGGQHFPFYRPAYREIYYADRQRGGGAIQDALTHVLNAGEWLLGPITSLAADAAHQVLPDVDVEDTVHVLARHGQALASYSLNQHQAVNASAMTIACESGVVQVEPLHHRWKWQSEPGGEWQHETLPPLERDDLFVTQAGQFLDALEGHAPVSCSLADATQTLRVNLGVLQAAEERRWVELA